MISSIPFSCRSRWFYPIAAAALLFPLFLSPSSGAASVSISVSFEDGVRTADARLYAHRGVSYVSLSALVDQLGGACRITPERVQVDLAAKTAWMGLDDTRVNASLADFSLAFPILHHDGEVLMAFSDVAPFLENAFRLAVSKDGPVRPVAKTGRAPFSQPLVEVIDIDPLEPLPTPRPGSSLESPIEVVIIDPGHGGSDSGCEGETGLTESALCLAVSERLRALLEKSYTVTALLTRRDDRTLTRAERASFANSNRGSLLVSIHAGASYAPNAHGFELFCCSARKTNRGHEGKEGQRSSPGSDYAARSWEMAEAVATALEEATGSANRGVRAVDCPLLTGVSMPGFLIEIGFLSNASEEALLQTAEYQTRIARGIAAGLTNHLAQDGSEKAQ